MAGPIATGALKPRTAVILAAVLNLVGACLSTEVAKTISGGFFDDALVTAPIILAGLVGAIVWNLVTWLLGLPSSSSHALFGGLIGAVIVGAGLAAVNGSVIVVQGPAARRSSRHWLPASPPCWPPGLPTGSPGVRRASTATPASSTGRPSPASLVALAHGTSDGQKTMGVITLVLIAADLQAAGTGPQWWVMLAAGLAIGLGTYSGGWRIMRTMGKGIVEIETPQGAASARRRPPPSWRPHTSASACPPPMSAPAGSSVRASAAQAPRSAGASPAKWPWRGCSPCRAPAWSVGSPRCCPISRVGGVIALLVLLAAACAVILRCLGATRSTTSTSPTAMRCWCWPARPIDLRQRPPARSASQAQEGQEVQAEERRLMKIEWAALGSVAVVSIFVSVLFVFLLAVGIRMISVATVRTNQGSSAHGGAVGGLRAARARRATWCCSAST